MPIRSQAELQRLFEPILAAAERQSGVAERFVDKDLYRIYLATVWANVVMDPAAIGLTEDDLESAHDVINLNAQRLIGDEHAITAAFRFVSSQTASVRWTRPRCRARTATYCCTSRR